MLLGQILFAAMIATNLAALAAARYFIAGAFGIPVNLIFFGRPAMRVEAISRWARPAIFLGCSAATYLVAASLFFAAFLIGGEERWEGGTTITVLEGRPAQAAGMRTGDRVVEVAGSKMERWESMSALIAAHPGEAMPIVVERGGQALHLTVTPARGDDGKGKIGIAPLPDRVELSVGQSLLRGVKSPAMVIANFVKAFLAIFRGSEAEVVGPVGIVRETERAAQNGAAHTLQFLGALNAYLWPGFCILSLFFLPSRRRKEPS